MGIWHLNFEMRKTKILKKRKLNLAIVEDKEESSLLIAISYEFDDILLQDICGDISNESWYLDTSASCHMIGIKTYFNYLDDTKNGIVRFVDGSTINYEGKGRIRVQ